MNLQEVKEALWYHSYGVDGVKHLNKAQYFEIENDNKIDFKKGISWFGLVSFDNYEQESDQCYILQMELWKKPYVTLSLIYDAQSHEIKLVFKYEDATYELADKLESKITWRALGFSLLPTENGFEMRLYNNGEQVGTDITLPKKMKYGFWRLKLGSDYAGKNGTVIDFAEDMALWTSNIKVIDPVFDEFNKTKQSLVQVAEPSSQSLN